MAEPPIPLKSKTRRLKSLNEFETPYWKGLLPWLRAERFPVWIILIGFMAGVAIGLLIVFWPVEAAQKTDWGVRQPPPSPADTNWPKHKFSNKIPARASSFDCEVSFVTDGDTFRCADGTRVRLSSIDSPEMPGSCRPGRKCAPGDPHAARRALASMISGRTVQCEPVGKSYERIAAWCSADGRDLSCAMVQSGHAIELKRHDPTNRLCRR